MSEKIPNPGSSEAIDMGCICPVLDNCYGRGYMGSSDFFVYQLDCKVHEEAVKRIYENQECM